jgi:hypothetical protein
VILRSHERESYTISAFVVRDWKTRVEGAPAREVAEIKGFLEDIRVQIRKQQAATLFFERLPQLGVGPIRSSVPGSCSASDLAEVIPLFFDGIPESSSWLEHFENLGETLSS